MVSGTRMAHFSISVSRRYCLASCGIPVRPHATLSAKLRGKPTKTYHLLQPSDAQFVQCTIRVQAQVASSTPICLLVLLQPASDTGLGPGVNPPASSLGPQTLSNRQSPPRACFGTSTREQVMVLSCASLAIHV